MDSKDPMLDCAIIYFSDLRDFWNCKSNSNISIYDCQNEAIGDTCQSEMNVLNSSNKLIISSATDTQASKGFSFGSVCNTFNSFEKIKL